MKKVKQYSTKTMIIIICLMLMANSTGAKAAMAAPVLTKTSMKMVVGDSVEIKLKNKPRGVKLTWRSANTGTASVTQKGAVRAVKKGSAVISCQWKQGKKKKTLKCKVTVVNPAFQAASITVTEGKSKQMNFRYRPKKSAYTWTTGNQRIAAVSRDGLVRGKKAGSTTVQCIVTTGGRRYKLTATVKVVKQKPVPTPTPKPDDNSGTAGESKEPDGGAILGGESSDGGTGGGQNSGDGSYIDYHYDANGNLTRIVKHTK